MNTGGRGAAHVLSAPILTNWAAHTVRTSASGSQSAGTVSASVLLSPHAASESGEKKSIRNSVPAVCDCVFCQLCLNREQEKRANTHTHTNKQAAGRSEAPPRRLSHNTMVLLTSLLQKKRCLPCPGTK